MSILLESLNQSSNNNANDIPNVGDSHFDDEMLSDEWLLKKLRVWKLTAVSLFIALIAVMIGWFISYQQAATANASLLTKMAAVVEQNSSQELSSENNQQAGSLSQPVASIQPLDQSQQQPAQNTSEAATAKLVNKQKYLPKKLDSPLIIKQSVSPKSTQGDNQSITSAANGSTFNQRGINSKDEIVEFESLSASQQDELPELQISSYAVSNNVKKSFVVLNGAFYGQGETIAPNLELVSIEKESIVVRYYKQLIRKKYGL